MDYKFVIFIAITALAVPKSASTTMILSPSMTSTTTILQKSSDKNIPFSQPHTFSSSFPSISMAPTFLHTGSSTLTKSEEPFSISSTVPLSELPIQNFSVDASTQSHSPLTKPMHNTLRHVTSVDISTMQMKSGGYYTKISGSITDTLTQTMVGPHEATSTPSTPEVTTANVQFSSMSSIGVSSSHSMSPIKSESQSRSDESGKTSSRDEASQSSTSSPEPAPSFSSSSTLLLMSSSSLSPSSSWLSKSSSSSSSSISPTSPSILSLMSSSSSSSPSSSPPSPSWSSPSSSPSLSSSTSSTSSHVSSSSSEKFALTSSMTATTVTAPSSKFVTSLESTQILTSSSFKTASLRSAEVLTTTSSILSSASPMYSSQYTIRPTSVMPTTTSTTTSSNHSTSSVVTRSPAFDQERKLLNAKVADLEDDVDSLRAGVGVLSTLLALIIIAIIVVLIIRHRSKRKPATLEIDSDMRRDRGKLRDKQSTYFRPDSIANFFGRGVSRVSRAASTLRNKPGSRNNSESGAGASNEDGLDGKLQLNTFGQSQQSQPHSSPDTEASFITVY